MLSRRLSVALTWVLAVFPLTISIPGVQVERCAAESLHPRPGITSWWHWWVERKPEMPCGSIQLTYPTYMIIGAPQAPFYVGKTEECPDHKHCEKIYELTVRF